MIGITLHGGLAGPSPVVYGAALADLASWQIAVVAFGFVFVILFIGYLLERWGLGLHA